MESKLSIIQKIFLIITTVVLGVAMVLLFYKFPYPFTAYDIFIGFIGFSVFVVVGFILKRMQTHEES